MDLHDALHSLRRTEKLHYAGPGRMGAMNYKKWNCCNVGKDREAGKMNSPYSNVCQ